MSLSLLHWFAFIDFKRFRLASIASGWLLSLPFGFQALLLLGACGKRALP
jgi:hypothetical protein